MAMNTLTHLFEGNTVAEAIQLGLDELNISESEAEIVIIQHESKRYWGVKRNRAKVKITKKQRPTWEGWILEEVAGGAHTQPPAQHRQLHTHLLGKVWIKDGSIQFKSSPSVKPIVIVPDDMTLYKNHQPVTGRTALSEGDVLSFDLQTIAVETTWSVRLDEHKQQVSLRVNPGKFYVPRLVDQLPTNSLAITIHKDEQINNQLTEDDVYKQLDRMKVVHGINKDAIKQACHSTASMTVIIAEGELPEHGKDGEVNFLIDMAERSHPFTENSDGTADFRESSYIPSLEEGKILGTVIEPTKGKDGRSLYGEVLKAKDGQPIIVKTGTGVEFMDSEQTVVSTNKGRPHIERLGRTVKISILPKLTQRGDVDVTTGNIHFIGDVEILGSINEGMLVHAEGQVAIYRHVMQGVIHAKNDILINGNVIRGSIVAGATNSLYAELGSQLKPFVENYEQCIHTLKQLAKSQKFTDIIRVHGSFSPVIKLLLESSCKNLSTSATKLVGTIYSMDKKIDKRWKSLAKLIELGLLKYHSKGFRTMEEMETLYNEAAALLDYISIPPDQKAHVEINYAMNSVITASGDVTIKGKGAIHTEIEAGGKIKVHGKVIGGHLYGKKGVELDEAGSIAGVRTVIKTDDDGVISIATCYSDVVLTVGNEAYKMTRDDTNIRAKLNTKRRIALH